MWKSEVIRKILNCDLYTGDMVQGKTIVFNHKIKNRQKVSKDKWIIVERTHEAIISHAMFNIAQEIMLRKAKPKTSIMPSVLARYLFCAECGEPMVRTTNIKKGVTYSSFVCSTFKKKGRAICLSHVIDEGIVKDIVLNSIQHQIDCIVNIDESVEKVSDKMRKNSISNDLNSRKRLLEDEAQKIKMIKDGLYDDYKSGLIKLDEYKEMKNHYESKYNHFCEKQNKIDNEIKGHFSNQTLNNDLMDRFKNLSKINVLSREIVVEFIEKIIVYNGKSIDINYKFNDQLNISQDNCI